ncbi:PREDICTED: proto-oncogene tyrosine-protein kinase receptor Ret [Ceratosolen solmsi marchali]|uniref:Proto-oncogene tyrosine-protein kinase receptor Ret n=1 Tax=Ceratosolen solmsi marchali TaxID=326594 RepID=A0AAJ7DY12_9HYME|nr:PREDICTED: proto-oncogene tyrosine-protein kinase receptor Ret [Ceratosolen solmsi marchali]
MLQNGMGLTSDVNLITLKTLKNDSTIPTNPIYNILSSKEKYANLDIKSANIILKALPEKGTSSAIVIQATDKSGAEAFLEVKIQSQDMKNNIFNCSDYLQDICFWNTSKYRIYENQPLTMLGTLGPDAYKSICPQFSVSRYELLNGTDFVYLSDNKVYSNDSLDRDTLNPPKGTGPRAVVNVRCVIWENTTGNQYTIDKVLNVDVLDQNDNPPIPQTNASVEIHLKDFTQGDRLDENDLIINDADNINTNTYSVRLLNDIYNSLNLTYDIISIDHPKRPPSTAIYARLYSRTTLLPKSPYRVILQVRDESLLTGFGNNTRNISLSFIGPQHHTTTTTTSIPLKQRIVYPVVAQLPRNSSQFYRIAQPLHRVNSKVLFALPGVEAFNVTSTGGIVFLANASALPLNSTAMSLRVEWRTPDQRTFSTTLTIKITEPTEFCKQNQMSIHSCANAKTINECEGRCGVGSGNSMTNDHYAGGCIWRSNKANNSTMTEKYETCSPDLTYCPNYICDELEHLDPRICPQDCAIESEVRFAEMNKGGRGIRSGFGTCWCDDFTQCTCGASFRRPTTGSGGAKEAREAAKSRRDRERTPPPFVGADARKATSSTCGPTCLIGIIAASLFVLIIIVGSFVLWRYRIVTKVPRRSCMHRGSDVANGLGILPLDYVDRGDGLLIGLESLSVANRTLLAPKNSPPDPKWEFPRSRLTIEQVLGEGEFGRVLRAKAQDIGGWSGQTTVAVKTLKEDASASELADLLSEYQLLKEAQHPNVIRLLGACTTSGGPIYLIIEFAEFGSLRNYLRRSRHLESEGRVPCSTLLLSSSPSNIKPLDQQCIDPIVNYTITPRDILSFAWQISKGMAYLADIKLVHRDLAARNVLLAAGKVCKISDFGLTRDVYEDDAYLKRSKGRVPVKWMAPESLADHVYTSKSDVWSFGVLLWELVTLGASPYPGVDVHNLYNLLKAGYRMEKPANCSYQLYKLMVSCWHEEAGMRPSFKELICHWERMLEDAVEYLDLNPRTVHNQAYFTSLHALDSPTSSVDSPKNVISYALVNSQQRTDAVNYLSRPSFELMSKSDKVDKLEALWHEPSTYPEGLAKARTIYVNEQQVTGHYESPIKLRNASVTSSSENELEPSMSSARPQSYIDMQAGIVYKNAEKEPEDLLLSFGSSADEPVIGFDL